MDRRGKKWTSYEIYQLYNLVMNRNHNPPAIASILGRSVKALEFKVQGGDLFDKNLILIDPPPSLFEFFKTLKKKRQIESLSFKKGKLKKLFSQKARHIKGVNDIPDNKQFLIPKITFQQAKEEHHGKDPWWRFAYYAQANPFMRSHVYNRENKICKLCSDPLSEADYQAHHHDYNHKCSYGGKKISIQYKNKERKIPNCEACYKQNAERFRECASRLHAVHGMCNKKLSGKV